MHVTDSVMGSPSPMGLRANLKLVGRSRSRDRGGLIRLARGETIVRHSVAGSL